MHAHFTCKRTMTLPNFVVEIFAFCLQFAMKVFRSRTASFWELFLVRWIRDVRFFFCGPGEHFRKYSAYYHVVFFTEAKLAFHFHFVIYLFSTRAQLSCYHGNLLVLLKKSRAENWFFLSILSKRNFCSWACRNRASWISFTRMPRGTTTCARIWGRWHAGCTRRPLSWTMRQWSSFHLLGQCSPIGLHRRR